MLSGVEYSMFGTIVVLLIVLMAARVQPQPIQKYVYDSGVPGPVIGLIAGVHGNERSGVDEITRLMRAAYFNNIRRGRVKIIPLANPWGYERNRRVSKLGDLNRIYTGGSSRTKRVRDSIMQFFSDCDVVVDFHEGWGWNRINPTSIGSTITPSLIQGRPLGQRIVESLNNSPMMQHVIQNDPRKRYDLGKDKVVCEIHSTMECYFRSQNRLHILVEVPGQNSKNPIAVRHSNVRTVVACLLREYQM